MKIERMNKGAWGKVRAFFDIKTNEGFVIKGFKIMDGINGLFVSMPSQKGKEDEWFDTVWLDKELRDELNQLALDGYGSQNLDTLSETNLEPPIETHQEPVLEKEEIKSEASAMGNEGKNKESFSEDDIPF